MNTLQPLLGQLQQYKRKYYLNRLLGGTLFALGLLLSAYLLVSVLEYYGNFSTAVRTILFYGFWSLLTYLLVSRIAIPIFYLLNIAKPITDETAAQQIGNYFPEVRDKLLNTLQLGKQNAPEHSLIAAAIAQKTGELSYIPFANAIDLSTNAKYLRWVAPPLLIIGILGIVLPRIFTESNDRLLNYNQVFVPQAPFKFELLNKDLKAYKNEDYLVRLAITGDAIPEEVFIVRNGRRQLMSKTDAGYEYPIKSVQQSEDFSFEAAGFPSNTYQLSLIARPSLLNFEVSFNYPSYLNKPKETISNAGSFTVPEGTTVSWKFRAGDADSLFVFTDADKKLLAASKDDDIFQVQKRIMQSTGYKVDMKNGFGANKEQIAYSIEAIPDQFPSISVSQYQDTAMYQFLSLGGTLADDYGLSRLQLHYRVLSEGGKEGAWKIKPIKIAGGQVSQSFTYNWTLDSLLTKPGNRLEYFVQVFDNDGVHGPKGARSGVYQFSLPSEKAMQEELEKQAEKNAAAMDKNLTKAEQILKEQKKIQDRLKTKRELGFQEKRMLEELMKKKEDLRKEIEALQKNTEKQNQKEERFNKQSEEIKEKVEKLQELMKELMDPEMEQLMQELNKLLQQNAPNQEELKKILDKMEQKDENLSKELDRTMELFKKLQFEKNLEKSIDKLEKLAEKQEQLAEKSADPNKLSKEELQDAAEQKKEDDKKAGKPEASKPLSEKEQKQEALKQQQEDLQEEFKQAKEELDKLEKDNKELGEDKMEMPDNDKDEEDVEKDQKDAEESLESKENEKASKKQKSASKKMKQMAQKLKTAQMEMDAEQDAEDAEALRQILENLLTLSFDQEQIMKEFRTVNQLDPRYLTLSQQQLKLKDDAKIIEDSLQALAKRVMQIRSFITKEVGELKGYLNEASDEVKARRQALFAAKQQLAMTSMNNLALMLSDALKNMQDQAAESSMKMKGKGKGKGKSKGKGKPGEGKPSLSQMQKQLNKQMEGLKKSGAQGRQLSEELAKMAAQQEAIRRAMQKMEGSQPGGSSGSGSSPSGIGKDGKPMGKEGEGKENGGSKGSAQKLTNEEIMKAMEQTEQDLVNKRLTQQTINRQQEIVTRLLEAENAMRERELDEKRESKTAKPPVQSIPPDIEKYLKLKEQQVEMLQSLPPNLTPFYKRELSRYFQEVK